MNVEISLTIIAACLVILLVLIICTLWCIICFLKNGKKLIENTQHQVQPILNESLKAVSVIKDLTINLKNKIEQTNPLFSSIAKTGHFIENFFEHSKSQDSPRILTYHVQTKKKVDLNDWIEWTLLGLALWQKIKKRMEK